MSNPAFPERFIPMKRPDHWGGQSTVDNKHILAGVQSDGRHWIYANIPNAGDEIFCGLTE